MLLIECPFCGSRPETEFRCGGEAREARPADPAALDDVAWSEHLFFRENRRGLQAERWIHQHGCGRWFDALRDTVTDRFVETERAGHEPTRRPSAPLPEGDGEARS